MNLLGPLLGVNRMWTMWNDHAQKNGGADFFNICPKSAILEKNTVNPHLPSFRFII
jgi:hypothetical protein